MKRNMYGLIEEIEVLREGTSCCDICKYRELDQHELPCAKCFENLKKNEYYVDEEISLLLGLWIKFYPEDRSTYPTEYDRYLVCRKDGKIHLETWNGTGWAYNGKVIVYYAKINNPVLKK